MPVFRLPSKFMTCSMKVWNDTNAVRSLFRNGMKKLRSRPIAASSTSLWSIPSALFVLLIARLKSYAVSRRSTVSMFGIW